MLVGIERHRPAMALQIALQSLEIGKRALRWHKAKLHQPAGGIIDEHQKRAGRRPIFEPAMVRTVDLNQFAEMLTTVVPVGNLIRLASEAESRNVSIL